MNHRRNPQSAESLPAPAFRDRAALRSDFCELGLQIGI
jgi:hypothetical protein